MMNNRFVLCSVLALTLPLAGCDQKAPNTPPPTRQYGTPGVIPNPVIGADELYSLVSPIALYPDSLLAQVLAASTARNDVAVKSLAAFPDVLAQMVNNPQWTKFLGMAYTRQPQDVMNAVQILRARAQQNGALTTSPQLRVQSTPASASATASAGKAVPAPAQTITIQPAQPGVVYVPVYPLTVYGNPPVIYYPSYVPPAAK
jgi:hypothetical protein